MTAQRKRVAIDMSWVRKIYAGIFSTLRKIPGVRMVAGSVDRSLDKLASLLNVPRKKDLDDLSEKMNALHQKFDELAKNVDDL